jgi:hypothetical protein
LDVLDEISNAMLFKTCNMVKVFKRPENPVENGVYQVYLKNKCSDMFLLFNYKFLDREKAFPFYMKDFQLTKIDAKSIGEIKGFIYTLLATRAVGDFLRASMEEDKKVKEKTQSKWISWLFPEK